MATHSHTNVLTEADIQWILSLPEVIHAKTEIESQTSGCVYFRIPLTDSLRTSILETLSLDLSGVSSIPMRWIKGDTAAHKDVGAHAFENTYLVYITDSEGQLLIGDASYSMNANSGFVFSEGVPHATLHTGTDARLMLGPMSELAEPVGAPPMNYFSNEADALSATNPIAYGSVYTVGSIDSGTLNGITRWRLASTSTGSSSQLGIYTNGNVLTNDGTYFLYPAAPCFLEGSTILAIKDGQETYVPVETLRKGDLVKTTLHGYKAVQLIGKGTIHNPGGVERSETRLYVCSPSAYPELTAPLVLTGDHSILVKTITEEQRAAMQKTLGKIYVTDKHYRLTAQHDKRSEPWGETKEYTIWHFALENEDPRMNYGVFANGGLLVETCSIRFMTERTNLTLV